MKTKTEIQFGMEITVIDETEETIDIFNIETIEVDQEIIDNMKKRLKGE